LRRYLRVYKAFFVSAFARELEYRANFFAQVIQTIAWVVFFLLILLVIYSNTDSVAGWSRADSIILAGTLFVISGIVSFFTFGLYEIPQQVRLGTMDFVITKPIDSQFWVSLRKVKFSEIGSLVAGFVTLIVGVTQLTDTPRLDQVFAYSILTVCSALIFYAFNMFLMTLSIFWVRVDNLWILSDSAVNVARYPIDIFQPIVQRVLTFGIPIAFLATIPARQLIHQVDWPMVAVGVFWTAILLMLTRFYWKWATARYTSASS
jgi:ABC-2 type transport system permease protein